MALLLDSCRTGNYQQTQQLLIENQGEDLDINYQDETEGDSPLIAASKMNSSEIVELLLKCGANRDLCTVGGDSALMVASKLGYPGVVRLLVQAGAKVDLTNKDGWSALMSTSQNGHTEIVKLLLIHGQCDVNRQDEIGRSASMLATQNGHIEIVKLLLEYGAEANLQKTNGTSALMMASHNGYTEIIELLLEYRADVDLPNNTLKTPPLTVASVEGHIEAVKLLLQHKAKVNTQNSKGTTALMLASHKGHIEIVRLLLDHGADVHLSNYQKCTASMMACKHKRKDVVNLLMEYEARTDLQHDAKKNESEKNESDRQTKRKRPATGSGDAVELSSSIVEQLPNSEHRSSSTCKRPKIDTQNTAQSNSQKPDIESTYSTSRCKKKDPLLILSNVLRYLLSEASEWYNIGVFLNIKEGRLNAIKKDNNRSFDCLREMISTWLKEVEPSWDALIEAVEPFNPRKAEEIRNGISNN